MLKTILPLKGKTKLKMWEPKNPLTSLLGTRLNAENVNKIKAVKGDILELRVRL